MLPVQEPHFENHCYRRAKRKRKSEESSALAAQTRTDWFFETQVVDKEETAVFGSEPVCERAGRQQAAEF